jgi:hypothetical protein
LPAHPPVQGHDGEVIRSARLAMVPAMSIPAAARLTGDDPGNWGHTERGYQPLARGRRRVIMHPPAPLLARMSSVTGVTPAQWEDRGRRDVAELLRGILEESRRQALSLSSALTEADDAFLRTVRASADLSEAQKAEFARMWHQGGREKVAAVIARLTRGPA